MKFLLLLMLLPGAYWKQDTLSKPIGESFDQTFAEEYIQPDGHYCGQVVQYVKDDAYWTYPSPGERYMSKWARRKGAEVEVEQYCDGLYLAAHPKSKNSHAKGKLNG